LNYLKKLQELQSSTPNKTRDRLRGYKYVRT